MARYTDAVCRLCRRQGEKLFLKGERCFTPKCGIERRNTPPGQHGARRRGKVSEHGVQLKEKQKARQVYGVLERQFRRHYAMASNRPGVVGENLLQELELRLDNVVYRLGFAESRSHARQVVNHGHITVNGRKARTPSARAKVGDMVGWVASSRTSELYKTALAGISNKGVPDWLALDRTQMSGSVVAVPLRGQIDTKLNEQAIVEFYSR